MRRMKVILTILLLSVCTTNYAVQPMPYSDAKHLKFFDRDYARYKSEFSRIDKSSLFRYEQKLRSLENRLRSVTKQNQNHPDMTPRRAQFEELKSLLASASKAGPKVEPTTSAKPAPDNSGQLSAAQIRANKRKANDQARVKAKKEEKEKRANAAKMREAERLARIKKGKAQQLVRYDKNVLDNFDKSYKSFQFRYETPKVADRNNIMSSIQSMDKTLSKASSSFKQSDDFKKRFNSLSLLKSTFTNNYWQQAEQAVKDLSTDHKKLEDLRNKYEPVFSEMYRLYNNLRQPSFKGDKDGGVADYKAKLDKLTRETRPVIIAATKAFSDKYGQDDKAIEKSFKRIAGLDTGWLSPKRYVASADYSKLNKSLALVNQRESELASGLLKSLKSNMRYFDNANAETRFDLVDKRFKEYREKLDKALTISPNDAETKALSKDLSNRKKAIIKQIYKSIEAKQWKPHDRHYAGSISADSIAKSVKDFLGGTITDVRIASAWSISERNANGQVLTYELPVEVAYKVKTHPDLNRVYYLVMVTRDPKMSPPFNRKQVGSDYYIFAKRVN